MHGPLPLGPVPGRGAEAGAGQKVGAIKQKPRIDVPGRGHAPAGHLVGLQHRLELIGQQVGGGRRGRRQGADGGQFRHPGVADLADVRQRGAGVGGQQFLVRRRPRQGLDRDADAGVAPLELGHQLAHRPALIAHGPEAQHRLAVTTRRAGRRRPARQQRQGAPPVRARGHAFSQPPVKPAVSRALRMCGSPRM